MATYGEKPPAEPTPQPEESPQAQPAGTTAKKTDPKQVAAGCGCLTVLLLAGFVGCTALFGGGSEPEKVTKRCEQTLRSKYDLKGYMQRSSTGFIPSGVTDQAETIVWAFWYDGAKGPSIAEQEGRAPTFKGLGRCIVGKPEMKILSIRYQRISDWPDKGGEALTDWQ